MAGQNQQQRVVANGRTGARCQTDPKKEVGLDWTHHRKPVSSITQQIIILNPREKERGEGPETDGGERWRRS